MKLRASQIVFFLGHPLHLRSSLKLMKPPVQWKKPKFVFSAHKIARDVTYTFHRFTVQMTHCHMNTASNENYFVT